jgi:hypothetical protein
MSVADGMVDKNMRKNFLLVASRSSSDHLVYYRDVVALLDLSMQANEFSLSLDLGKS